jgi:hypothetical protein
MCVHRCRCTGRCHADACTWHACGALSLDALRWQLISKFARLAAAGRRRHGDAAAVCVPTFGMEGLFWKGSLGRTLGRHSMFGSALNVSPVPLWEDFSPATALTPSSSPGRLPKPLILNPKPFYSKC